ncbi:MAG: Tm-1-like ATP-binding domain-containing protein [Proteobacteria bacterium]|nr:Tm-1-like ATP-binding domain-containing protein [Pseudomonadota bacterium]
MDKTVKNIVIIVTLDTKGEEALYVKELIKKRGHNPLVMDIGIRGKVPFRPDFPREEEAIAAGRTLQELGIDMGTYSSTLSVMALGASKIMEDLIAGRKMDALLSIGGGLGTTQALEAMRKLPVNIPKLALSTVAFAGGINIEMVSIDQGMIQSPADLWGVNRITKMILRRAAGAICGMAEEQEETEAEGKRLVAISALGVHAYVERCKSLLLEKGYEPIVFHSIGTGGLEKLVREGYFSGTLDLSCYEIVNHICGGLIKGGDEKFTAACEMGIPQVISSGGLDFFPLSAAQPIPTELRERRILSHGMVNLIKTTPQEQEQIGALMAEKINKAIAPIVVLVPLEGFSKLDHDEEMPFYDPGAGRRFAGILRERVSNDLVEIEEIHAHINDPIFSERATVLLLSKM